MKRLTLALLAGATALVATQASSAVITFSFSGRVAATFIDVDNAYGFGAGANLTGDSVTDVYTIDTSTLTYSSGGVPGDPGSIYEEYDPGALTGADTATSTINGHTVTIGPTNGAYIYAYLQQVYSPNPYDQAILDIRAVGFETTGTAVGSEFLFRDEVASYSTAGLPLSIVSPGGGYTLSPAALTAAGPWSYTGVYFPYAAGATAGFFTAVPEPASWAVLLIGIGLIGGGLRMARRQGEVSPA